MRASTAAGPLRDFYEALLAKGRRPTMACLALMPEDYSDPRDGLEERSPFRRQTFELGDGFAHILKLGRSFVVRLMAH
jgi:hypothetical protein